MCQRVALLHGRRDWVVLLMLVYILIRMLLLETKHGRSFRIDLHLCRCRIRDVLR